MKVVTIIDTKRKVTTAKAKTFFNKQANTFFKNKLTHNWLVLLQFWEWELIFMNQIYKEEGERNSPTIINYATKCSVWQKQAKSTIEQKVVGLQRDLSKPYSLVSVDWLHRCGLNMESCLQILSEPILHLDSIYTSLLWQCSRVHTCQIHPIL